MNLDGARQRHTFPAERVALRARPCLCRQRLGGGVGKARGWYRSRRRRHGTSRRHLFRQRAAASAPVARVCARHARMRMGEALLGGWSNMSACHDGGGTAPVVATCADDGRQRLLLWRA